MKWILILIVLSSHGVTAHSVELNNEPACRTAADDLIRSSEGHIKAYCYEKGMY